MSTVMCNFFYSKKYQKISEIIQFHVFNTADSKKFADMSWKHDLDYTYERLMEITKDIIDLTTIEDKLRDFVSDFFIEEDEGKNIPYISVVKPLDFVNLLDTHLQEVYNSIHNKWYVYARRDVYTYDDTLNAAKDAIHSQKDNTININRDINTNSIQNDAIHSQKDNTMNNNREINTNSIQNDPIHSQKDNTMNNNRDINTNSIQNDTIHSQKDNTMNNNRDINTNSIQNDQIYESNKKNKLITDNKENQKQFESLAPLQKIGSNKIALPYLYFVPGGRFKEAYYWDSYWILIGLLSSNMNDSAFELVRSMSYLINKFGYIPNGTRQYYLGRSQPPFFGEMLKKLYDANIHRDWILNDGLFSLEKEYEWWMKHRHFDEGKRLNRYKLLESDIPRPEAFKEDLPFKTKYNDIWAAAESGWDFSSRWFKDGKTFSEICTGDIIPVDLNIYLLTLEQLVITLNNEKLKRKLQRTELLNSALENNSSGKQSSFKENNNNSKLDINEINKLLNLDDTNTIENIQEKINKFMEYKNQRIFDINEVLWNDELKTWSDFNTKTKTHNKSYFFSNITPLFANVPVKYGNLYNILNLYKKELFGYPGGMPASNVEVPSEGKGQQWDFPNVWAPLVQMFTEYLLDIEYPLALHVAKSFFRSVYKGLGTNRNFHEKYNCLLVGEKGKGGEYEPQEGFGWTNGTISWMIKIFGNKLTLEDDHKDSYEKICKLLDDKMEKSYDENQFEL